MTPRRTRRWNESLWQQHLRLYPLPPGYVPVPTEALRKSVRLKQATAINNRNKRREAKREAAAEEARRKREERRKADTRTPLELLLATDPGSIYGPPYWNPKKGTWTHE